MPPPIEAKPPSIEVRPSRFSPRVRLTLLLALAAALRLPHLDAPPIGRHSWRQADTAAIARNFYREGFALFYPRIDARGVGPGFVEMEFPLYSWLIALGYAAVGVHEWVGRLLSLAAALLAVTMLYKLVALRLNERAAFWAALFYAILPLNVFSGRAIMPDQSMIACSIAGLYFFSRWTLEQRPRDFFAAWLGVTLAALLKLPLLYLGLPLLWLGVSRHGVRWFRDWRVWAFAAGVLLPVAAWYAHGYALGQATGLSFGILFPEKWARWNFLTHAAFYQQVFLTSIAERNLAWAGFLLFLIGLFLPRQTKEERLFDVWLLAFFIYVGIAQGGHWAHDYYQLPLVPIAAAYIGKAFARGWNRPPLRAALWVALAATAAVSAYKYNGMLRWENAALSPEVRAGRLAQAFSAPGARVITVNDRTPNDPTLLYLCDRHGWTAFTGELNAAVLQERAAQGATLAVGLKFTFADDAARGWLGRLRDAGSVAHEDEQVFIVRLRPE